MLSLRSSDRRLNSQPIANGGAGDRGWTYFWDMHFIPIWLPVLLGLGLGLVLAYLIARESWHFVVPLAFALPVLILFVKYPFVAIPVWLSVLPFFLYGASVADRYVYWIVHRAIIPAALGIGILSSLLKIRPRRPVQLGVAELAPLVFLVLGATNILVFNRSPLSTLYKFYDCVFVPFCVYWLIRMTAPRGKAMRWLLGAAFVTVLVQSVIGLLAWFAPQALPSHWLRIAGSRTVGTLNNPAVYTSTLIVCSLLLYQYALNCKSKVLRFVLVLVFCLAIFCVAYSFSRGSWVGGLMTLTGLMILYPKLTFRLTIVLAVIVYALGSTVLAGQVAFALERLTGEAATRSAESRIISNNASLEMIKARPLWGWGFHNYDRYDFQFYSRVANVAVIHDGTSHNTYLTIMAEMGLLAFFFYMFPVGWWLLTSIMNARKLPKDGFWSWRLLAVLWLAMMHMFVVSNAMDMIRFHPFGTTLWWMALGLIANLVHPYLTPDLPGQAS